jgi:hypothetical protein
LSDDPHVPRDKQSSKLQAPNNITPILELSKGFVPHLEEIAHGVSQMTCSRENRVWYVEVEEYHCCIYLSWKRLAVVIPYLAYHPSLVGRFDRFWRDTLIEF